MWNILKKEGENLGLGGGGAGDYVSQHSGQKYTSSGNNNSIIRRQRNVGG